MLYRRREESVVWHFEEECIRYPRKWFVEEEKEGRPDPGSVCRRCAEIAHDREHPAEPMVVKRSDRVDTSLPTYYYRRNDMTLAWHFKKNCGMWPENDYVEHLTNTKLRSYQLCPKCLEMHRKDKGLYADRKHAGLWWGILNVFGITA